MWGMALDRESFNWAALGRDVQMARVDKGWSKEEAARKAEVSSITWKRVEDGMPVQDAKLGAVLKAVGMGINISDGSGGVISFGLTEPTVGGDPQDAERAFVESPGERVERTDSDSEVMRMLQRMDENVQAMERRLSERLDRLEQHGSERVDGAGGET